MGGVVRGVLVLLLLVGLAAAAGYLYLRSSIQNPSGEVPLPAEAGLVAPVEVRLDEWAVPYVYAETLADAFFAQGWLHASHRLWQMELLRRTARGQLAAILGQEALAVDRMTRTLDLWGAAERALGRLRPGERELLQAYAAGANARIRSWEGAWPPEFLLLGIEPGHWSPRASLAVGKLMALNLTAWEKELSRGYASRHLPAGKFRFLDRGYPQWAPTILEDPIASPAGVGRGNAVTRQAGSVARCPSVALPGPNAPNGPVANGAADAAGSARSWDPLRFLASLSVRQASNAWVVAGSRTQDSHPILANDMHLPLRAPATWYLAALSAGDGYAVAGVTLPGAPGVVVGFNRDLAWGFTNGMVDDIDFAVEEVGPTGRCYRDGETFRPFTVRTEHIAVHGREEPLRYRVRYTVRGPIITDALAGFDVPLSVRWVPAQATGALRGLLGINRANTVAGFDRALWDFASPHQNVVFADRSGAIGYRLGGRIPKRQGWSGAVPVRAERLEEGWDGFWPPALHPAGRNPEQGFFATANNLQGPALYGVIGQDYPLPFRAQRLVDRLTADDDWTLQATRELARDTHSLFADRVGHRAVAAARRVGAGEAARTLATWNHEVTPQSRAAPLFYAWLYGLRDRIAADEYNGGGRWAHFPDTALLRLLEGKGGKAWVDDVGTPGRETLSGVEEAAMRNAVEAVNGKTWGVLHEERHRHPLGRVSWLDAVFGFDVGPYPGPGARHTLRPDDYVLWRPIGEGVWRPPWTSDAGPTMRFVAALRPEGIEARFLVPTGQSGNPLSPHYRDMTARWREGRLVAVSLPGDTDAGEVSRRYLLLPANDVGSDE